MERQERRKLLAKTLADHPHMTDRQLAQYLRVSTQTIRLDRMVLGIPEMRSRTGRFGVDGGAAGIAPKVAGQLVTYERGRSATSRQVASPQMAYSGSSQVQGHVLFAQAESLALATVGRPSVRTGVCRVRFRRAVHVGERLIARASVLRSRQGRWVVLVTVSAGDEVFRGKFEVEAVAEEAVE